MSLQSLTGIHRTNTCWSKMIWFLRLNRVKRMDRENFDVGNKKLINRICNSWYRRFSTLSNRYVSPTPVLFSAVSYPLPYRFFCTRSTRFFISTQCKTLPNHSSHVKISLWPLRHRPPYTFNREPRKVAHTIDVITELYVYVQLLKPISCRTTNISIGVQSCTLK